MTTMNTSKLLDLIGQLKVVTLVIGIIDIGLAASGYLKGVGIEEYFLSMIIIAFILSFLFVALIIAGLIPVTDLWKKIDMVYHGLIAVLMSIGIILMLISLLDKRNAHPDGHGSWIAKRCFALIFALANTVIYGYIGYGIYRAPDV